MNLADCYRVLGLRSGASFEDVKSSYRRLARQYHPDTNPDDQQAKEKFIEVTAAYKFLLETIAPTEQPTNELATESGDSQKQTAKRSASTKTTSTKTKVKVTRKEPKIQLNPDLSPLEHQLKEKSYQQLQQLLKNQRFPRAIALVEGLAERLPKDPEVKQWKAIAYQRWGRQLVDERQVEKARIYLKKALKTDPHNRSLWAEVEKEFRRIEKIL
ncbi:MAG: J domain-containing protein [Cyanobacteria bacterium]|nr:J domain-containing protein [Cyanobacteriota bacterium]MDW8200761.1 J domain-containing protein [Cyanobacteriota bacterium SKYGB_h_bin112]